MSMTQLSVDQAARVVVEGGSHDFDDAADLVKVFDREGNFAALCDAEEFLRERGFSYGALCGASPIGVMLGDIHVPKWRHLGGDVAEWLHGRLDSNNWRAGPVTLTVRKSAPAAVIEAFLSERRR